MGFNPRLAPYTINHLFGGADIAASEVFHIFRFPVAGRIIDAWATNTGAIATTTHTVSAELEQFSTSNAVVATLGSWAAGSTWAVDVPRQITMTSVGSTAQFSAGEWVRLDYAETSNGLWTELGFQIDYILGYDV